MKTIYKLILCSVAFAVFASCEKREEISEGIQTELTARIESYGDTRTSLSDLQNGNYYPLWSEGDEIAVYGMEIPNLQNLYCSLGKVQQRQYSEE